MSRETDRLDDIWELLGIITQVQGELPEATIIYNMSSGVSPIMAEFYAGKTGQQKVIALIAKVQDGWIDNRPGICHNRQSLTPNLAWSIINLIKDYSHE